MQFQNKKYKNPTNQSYNNSLQYVKGLDLVLDDETGLATGPKRGYETPK